MTKATYTNSIQHNIVSHGGFVVSSGTLCTEDLLECFADILQLFDNPEDMALCEEARALAEEFTCVDHADDVLCELEERLNDRAPEEFFFGASEDDGACFGFWACTQEEGE